MVTSQTAIGINMEEWWVEFSRSKNRSGAMLPLDRVQWMIDNTYNSGYRSHYMLARTDALEVRSRGHSRGFAEFEVAAIGFIIDLDDGDASVEEVEARITAKGWKYNLYFSGGKGYHFELFHDLMQSRALPYSHLKFVESWCPEADMSLYQHGRLISLPGRIHERTRKPKKLIKSVEGDLVTIEIKQPPVDAFHFAPNGGLTEFQVGLDRLANLSVCEPTPGNRHTSLWGASKELANAGVPYEVCLALVLEVNERWQHPKSEADVTTSVGQAYSR